MVVVVVLVVVVLVVVVLDVVHLVWWLLLWVALVVYRSGLGVGGGSMHQNYRFVFGPKTSQLLPLLMNLNLCWLELITLRPAPPQLPPHNTLYTVL